MGIISAIKNLQLPAFNSIVYPSPAEAKWMTDRVQYSPDMGWLEMQEFQLLFVPDVLRSGYSHYEIGQGTTLCGGYTEKNFAYWYQDIENHRLGIPMRQDKDSLLRYMPPALKIKGELQAILSSRFDVIDTHMRNTKQFRRQRMNILVPYRMRTKNITDLGTDLPRVLQAHGEDAPDYVIEGSMRVYIIRAWMYIGVPDYWNDLLDAGFRGFKTVNHYESRMKRPWLLRYYDFPKQPIV